MQTGQKSNLYTYIIPGGLQEDIVKLFDYLEANKLDAIEDIISNGKYPFTNYTIVIPKSTYAYKVEIDVRIDEKIFFI